MNIETHALIGHALDFGVAMVLKKHPRLKIKKDGLYLRDTDDNLIPWSPSGIVGQGMEIALARRVMMHPVENGEWACRYKGIVVKHRSPLVAAMRVIVMAEIERGSVCVPFEVAEIDPAATVTRIAA